MERSSASRHFKFPSNRKQGRISLREWVDRPGRSVNSLECLRIFRQVVAAVENMHNKGTAVNNIRPSCLAVSSLDCVSFIEASSSCYDFEFSWYRSPAEQGQGQNAFAADVYKLGVLLFELFCGFESEKQKHGLMLELRDRVLPPEMLLRWPKIASLCLWLMHPQTSKRPELSHILQSGILDEGRDDLEEHEVVMKLSEEIQVHDSLLEFLLKLKRTKQASANKLHGVICFLSNDIEEVVSERSFLMKKSSFHEEENCDCSTGCKGKNPLPSYKANDDSTSWESKKRFRLLHKEKTLSKSSRIMDNFKKLEAAYFSLRCKPSNLASKHGSKKLKADDINNKESNGRTEQSSVDDMVSKQSEHGYGMGEWINPFLEGLCKYLTFSKFKVCAELKQGDLLNSPNLICSLAFDRDKHFFATTGVNKKIKVFEYDAILNDDRDIHYPMVEMVGRSRFSNVCWSSYIKSQIASSDFEGLVQVWDVSRSQVLVDMREHEKRVWSIDFSLTYPTVLASGSDDYTTKLWNINQGGSVSTIRTKANVCSVQFSPSGNLIAIGSADHNVYCYDLRNIRLPLCTIVGHAKTVSYVKFLDSSTLVSSSTDSTLKLWDLSMNTSRVIDSPAQTFSGHTNVKNFVGLSISDGYIATGSETNEIFVYQKVFSMPVLSYNFGCIDPISGLEDEGVSQFISCVCWRGDSPTLLAANSSGNIKILEMI